ncbi:general substrate transporter [Phakopsora pachyrhizi]|uniref:General substrate transporter n=1 Tax=Phakopsora pachyrhizi TaxID=170000 RepID=A0AAV0BMT0_PHAPC|nr:general substrate transporter [Phakopsora pachyrhizi]
MDPGAYFVFAVTWIVTSAFSYGYHISALNSAQDVITCRWRGSSIGLSDETSDRMVALLSTNTLGPCIPMSDFMFGFLTSSYTIGGFAGSIYASRLADLSGRKKTLLLASVMVGIGSITMAISNSFLIILIGRTIIGLGCGLNTVLVPLYLSEIAPVSIRGSVGVLNQLAIVTGIFTSQAFSLPFSKPFLWRWIFLLSGVLSAIQLLTSPIMIESPKWAMDQETRRTKQNSFADSSDRIEHRTSDQDLDDSERQNLLNDTSMNLDESEEDPGNLSNSALAQTGTNRNNLNIFELISEASKDPALSIGLKIVLITQVGQQLSGINAVLYYSTSIMKSVLPTQAIYISLFITAINLLMTFPPLFLIDRLGRRPLLLISSTMMALSSFILGHSINLGLAIPSSLAIVIFVAGFSLGLGPVPFVILSEVVPNHAISSVGSLGLAVNWASNFIVGLMFLPLRNWLNNIDGDGDGNVFFIFTALLLLITILILKCYKR